MRLGPAYGLPRGLLRGSDSVRQGRDRSGHWQGRPESGPMSRCRRWSRALPGEAAAAALVEGITVRDEAASSDVGRAAKQCGDMA